MLVSVLVEIESFNEKTFTYSVPSDLESKVKIGMRVSILFGNRKIKGIIIGFVDNTEYDTKDILEVLDDEPILNDELIRLGKIMSDIYICPLMSAYLSMLPSALKFNKNNTKIKYVTFYEKIKDLDNPSKGEKNILDLFLNKDLVNASSIKNKNILNRLVDNGILKKVLKEKYRLEDSYEKQNLKVLTESQTNALNKIINTDKQITLLRGVTGSGKTEIYMHLIKKVLDDNKKAIVLVPEISLTTQLINRFRGIFSSNIAVLHSSLSDGERYDEYRKIKDGKVSLVIGTRSAILSPIDNIGIIIIDEEHVDSYKQENNPRYNTLDIAIERAKYWNSKIVLGSATPSLESYAKASVGRYNLVELLERVNDNKLPEVFVIDMKDEIKKGNSIISSLGVKLINDRLEKKEQIMILINRRGYSNYVMCNECGNVLNCPNCDISLTYHKSSNTLRCHYCEYSADKPNVCPNCNSKYLIQRGIGTEKIEEYLNENFNARVIRMDKDSTTNKGMHQKIINDFNDYKYDILLGTQMISKGLDFPNVTLVIVLNGDSTLNVPDYRSSEKSFDLLTQVSGRSGRNKPGVALIQTYNPNHYSIEYSKTHDYKSFYNKEISIRKKLYYPPFCHIVSIRILSSIYEKGNIEIEKIKKYLLNNLDNKYIVLGPSISIKINNIYRFQLIIKYKEKDKLYEVLNNINNNIKRNGIKLEIDFNPIRL